jgi:dihydrofolate reductase
MTKIRTHLCISADGYVTTPDGWPAHAVDPAFAGRDGHGFPEFLQGVEAVVMGRTTFTPALAADSWPWPDLDVFVLGSERPEGTPDAVVVEADPQRLLERLRAANRGGDVHLLGGPTTIETFRRLGAVDELQLVVVPLLLGGGLRLTPALATDARLTLLRSRSLPGGSVEIAYGIA